MSKIRFYNIKIITSILCIFETRTNNFNNSKRKISIMKKKKLFIYEQTKILYNLVNVLGKI